jgi:hypothetical protein
MAQYGIVPFYPGQPDGGELMLLHVLTQAVKFSAGLPESKAVAVTAATAETIFSIKHDGTEVATVTFAAGQSTGTFTAAASFVIPVDGKFTITAPATADATLADIAFTVVGLVENNKLAVRFTAAPSLDARLTNIPRCRVRMQKFTRFVGRLSNA